MWRATTEDTNNVLEDENDLVLAMKIKQDVLPCERKPVKCLGQNISSAGSLPNSGNVAVLLSDVTSRRRDHLVFFLHKSWNVVITS